MGVDDIRGDDEANYLSMASSVGKVTPSIYRCDTNTNNDINNRPSSSKRDGSTKSNRLEELLYPVRQSLTTFLD